MTKLGVRLFCGAAVILIAKMAGAQATNTFPSSGNVGIGTTGPSVPLSVNALAASGATDVPIVSLNTVYGSTIWYVGGDDTFYSNFMIWAPDRGAGNYLNINKGTGNVGIGTTSPGAKLEVDGNVKLTSGSGASITFADGSQQTTAWTGALCGGDYAESVDVTGKRARYEPGDVLVVDPQSPDQFAESAAPYSTLVAGIYSTKPGAVGRRFTDPDKLKNEIPMAMVGIVPTKVSAENGAVRPGDLLVTSATPGYAMKGTDRERLSGAIVGKALQSLSSGKGVIDVLVSLQ